MQCCQCQKELPDGALFCKYCGARQMPRQAEGEETPHTQTPRPIQRPPEPTAVQTVKPRAVETGVTEGSPAPHMPETLGRPLVDAVPQPEESVLTGPVPERIFQDIPEDVLTAEGVQPEPGEALVFDLDQILRGIAPDAAVRPGPEERAPAAGVEELLRFDPDAPGRPSAATASAEPARGPVPLETNQPTAPAETATAVDGDAAPDAAADGDRTELPAQEFAAADRPAPASSSGGLPPAARTGEGPTAQPDAVLPAPEQKETAETAAEPRPHAEQEAFPPAERLPSGTHEKSPVSVKGKLHGSSDESAEGSFVSSEKRAKKSVVPVLWRLGVIAAELGVIAVLSSHLFF